MVCTVTVDFCSLTDPPPAPPHPSLLIFRVTVGSYQSSALLLFCIIPTSTSPSVPEIVASQEKAQGQPQRVASAVPTCCSGVCPMFSWFCLFRDGPVWEHLEHAALCHQVVVSFASQLQSSSCGFVEGVWGSKYGAQTQAAPHCLPQLLKEGCI